jgi:hypothetical protein
MTKGNGMKKMEKNRSPALDIGSHINVPLQPSADDGEESV